MKQDNFISAVIYVEDNSNYIESFLPYIAGYLKNNYKFFEIILVCDNANSNKKIFFSKLINEKKLDAQISIIYLENKVGIEKAMIAGMDLAIGDYIFEFNDISILIENEIITQLYKLCLEGNDASILVPESISFFDKVYYSLMKKFGYFKYDEYREDEILTILSRRMINRIGILKKQITNRSLFYKMSGLSCKYLKYNGNYNKCQSYNLKSKINTLSIFSNIFIKLYSIFGIVSLLISVGFIIKKDYLCSLFSLFFMLIIFAIVFLIKKQSLSLEYLWTDAMYQYSSIDKISKETSK